MPFAFVGAAVAVGGAITAENSRKDAKSGQKKALRQEERQFNELLAASNPFGEYRDMYAQELNALMADPSSVRTLPGYQFQFDQGADALERSSTAAGFAGSGNLGAALVRYGQDFADNYFNNRVQVLSALAGANAIPGGPGAPSAAAGIQAAQNNFENSGRSLESAGAALASLEKLAGRFSGRGGVSAGSVGGTGAGGGAFTGFGGGGGLSDFAGPTTGALA